MTQGPQASGDYGYDLAHEEKGGGNAPAPSPGPERTAPPVSSSADQDEDFGYDEAHDF